MAVPRRVLIMGAAGRDFHNFNVIFRDDPSVQVVAFTATQIPGIESRKYPASLAGPRYPEGIPIFPEEELAKLIPKLAVETCVFSYSDVDYGHIGHLIALANAHGADFLLLGAQRTMLQANVPVIAICAVRTGSGKSQTTRRVAGILLAHGKKVVVVRHPMPYGDLASQAVERFATYADLDRYETTIEEREEYEPHIDKGTAVYAGVDYEKILRQAEREAEILLWDGGNNDTPFFRPNLHIVIADPLRPGHGLWPEADQRTRGDDRRDSLRRRRERDADRPQPRPEDEEARGPRALRARRDRPSKSRRRPPGLGDHLTVRPSRGPKGPSRDLADSNRTGWRRPSRRRRSPNRRDF